MESLRVKILKYLKKIKQIINSDKVWNHSSKPDWSGCHQDAEAGCRPPAIKPPLTRPLAPYLRRFNYGRSATAIAPTLNADHFALVKATESLSLCLWFWQRSPGRSSAQPGPSRWSEDGMINGSHYLLSLARPLILGDGGQDGGRLLAAHHWDPGVGPHVEEPRAGRGKKERICS